MTTPLLTLTTDFGAALPYLVAMKGGILSIHPAARLLDLSHSLPPQDVRHCGFFLRSALPYFPSDTLHVIVVDPGVGTARELLYVESGGQRLLVPDNGCWTAFAQLNAGPPRVRQLRQRRYWRAEVSATFHGRDILAPAAGHLSLGLDPGQLGPLATSWVELPLPEARPVPGGWEGEVVFVDDFGNLITNLPLEAGSRAPGWRVELAGHVLDRHVVAYGDAPPGTVVTLRSSVATLEIAVVQGNAAARLQAAVGAPVRMLTNEAGSG
jgi:S-adenosyl-L-methionine hydrolase (adenosine-forming)